MTGCQSASGSPRTEGDGSPSRRGRSLLAAWCARRRPRRPRLRPRLRDVRRHRRLRRPPGRGQPEEAPAAGGGADPLRPSRRRPGRRLRRLRGAPDARTIVPCPNLFPESRSGPTSSTRCSAANAADLLPRAGDRRLPLLDRSSTASRLLLAPKSGRQSLDALDRRRRLRLRRQRSVLKAAVPGDHVPPEGPQRRPARAGRPRRPPRSPTAADARPRRRCPCPLGEQAALGEGAQEARGRLPDRYRQFLDDVEPILTDVERDTFLRLASDYQRDRFIDDFWKRRSVDSDGLRVDFREIYELRLQQVKERFRNVNTRPGADLPPPRAADGRPARSTARTSTTRSRSGTTSGSSRSG